MRILLEIFRVIFMFLLLGAIMGPVIEHLYLKNEIAKSYSWLGMTAFLIWFFVLYRNRLQFSGWYQGSGMSKLPENLTKGLIIIALVLFLLPFLIAYL